MQLARFLIGGLSTVWTETYAYSLNGIHFGDFDVICQTAKLKLPPNIPHIWYLLIHGPQHS